MIGTSYPRIDAVAKVTGAAPYPGDLPAEGALWMKILFARRPHARILRIDTSRAEAYPGVVAVFTAKDVPVNEYGLIVPDQPVLCGPGSSKTGADVVRFVGDQVALVVAETEAAAAAARDLIEVEWHDLPVVTDPVAAMQAGAPQILPEVAGNVIKHLRIRHGDVERVWEDCAVIVAGTYHTPYQEHAFLQPEAGLGYLDEEGRVTVQVAGQWAHEDQLQIAHALDLPVDRVRVIYPAIGGAFGGREDMSVQIVLALAAYKLRRPVRIIWSREESILGHHKRHPYQIRSRWGARADGKVLAVEIELIADAGPYTYTSGKVLGNATVMASGPYEIPNVKVDAYAVLTNNIVTGAFRGFGGPQAAFAAEQQMNKLAAALGLDPVAIRLRNALTDASIWPVGTRAPHGVTIKQVIERCGWEGGWNAVEGERRATAASRRSASTVKVGKGFACAFKNIGFSFGAPESCAATVELRGKTEIERVVVFHAGAECGQGAHTAFVQMAAEAVGVPVERVELVASDTATSGNSGSASASRMTYMAGNAIRGAADAALRKWQEEERPARAEYVYRPPATTVLDPDTGRGTPNFAYGYVAESVEVEVDLETGQVHVVNVTCVDDVGKAINPALIEGQIEGAVVQAGGYALLEDLLTREGQILNPTFSTYLIPTVRDIPDLVRSVIVEHAEPNGPWGVRGMAEMPYLPLTPAIAAAIHDATGVWLDSFPFTPERVYLALRRASGLS
jgi:CO/xanthine dehydrogenase Mo-binding subunit